MIENNMGMGNFGLNPNIPTVEELWKSEKNYRSSIILFGLSLLITFILLISSYIWNQIEKNNIINNLVNKITVNVNDARNSYDSHFLWAYTVLPSIIIAGLSISLSYFVISIIKSYRMKNFNYISNVALRLFSFSVFLTFILISITTFWYRIIFDFNGGILFFVSMILILVSYILTSPKIMLIKRIFFNSTNFEKLKKENPNFVFNDLSSKQGNFSNAQMGPFGPISVNGLTSANPQTNIPNNINSKNNEEFLAKKLELENMTLSDLKKVAKKLSISGTENMDRKSLIDTIMRLTTS